ncbi:hypothetical protein [Kamptonema sp. UHCC 0994]|nr:hypothetical protein [Kamptonema sp. UHCC 0994]MDF0551759.1 hypothetical protein [Kamptonema sp. UHCC 0994]
MSFLLSRSAIAPMNRWATALTSGGLPGTEGGFRSLLPCSFAIA